MTAVEAAGKRGSEVAPRTPAVRRPVLLRALAVTIAAIAGDWTWWAYSWALRIRSDQFRGHIELGESAAQHLLFAARWRLPGTLAGAAVVFLATYLLLRDESAVEAPGRGFDLLRLYAGAVILVMLMHVLVRTVLGRP